MQPDGTSGTCIFAEDCREDAGSSDLIWAAGLTVFGSVGYTTATYIESYRKHILQDPGDKAEPEAERKISFISSTTPVPLLTELNFLLPGKGKLFTRHIPSLSQSRQVKRTNSGLRGNKLITGIGTKRGLC